MTILHILQGLVGPRLVREQVIVAWMIGRHCRRVHRVRPVPCPACDRLTAAIQRRLRRCPHGHEKPSCPRCDIHCFTAQELEEIREVMRAASPGFSALRVWLFGMKVLDGLRSDKKRG